MLVGYQHIHYASGRSQEDASGKRLAIDQDHRMHAGGILAIILAI
jgi:hypothetical protein